MSKSQPTVIDKLKETKKRKEKDIKLLMARSSHWDETAAYSGNRTIKNLNKQIERIDEIISYVQESEL